MLSTDAQPAGGDGEPMPIFRFWMHSRAGLFLLVRVGGSLVLLWRPATVPADAASQREEPADGPSPPGGGHRDAPPDRSAWLDRGCGTGQR